MQVSRITEHRADQKPMKTGKAMRPPPPKRGQVKAKMFEELVETVISMTTGGSSGSSHFEQDQSSNSTVLVVVDQGGCRYYESSGFSPSPDPPHQSNVRACTSSGKGHL